MKKPRKSRVLRRCIQAASLMLFLFLLFLTAWPLADLWVPHDVYLRLDPLVALLVPVAARAWIGPLVCGLALIAASVVFGRVFCGYICPMGITLGMARRTASFFFGPSGKPVLSPRWRLAKYAVLTVMATAATLGVNLLFWGSPVALATRLYALLVHPLLLLAGATALDIGPYGFIALGPDSLAYASITPRRFETVYFVLGFFCLLFFLERIRPRFWCRYICPAGAVLALVSRRPLWRRRVSECIRCGQCVRECPTEAIFPGGLKTAHAECIACRTCVDVCPVRGVHFTFSGPEVPGGSEAPATERCALPSRRAFLGAVGAGAVLTGVQYSGKNSFLAVRTTGNPWFEALVRPPGALPEPDFLDRCVRCGECMKVCPTNTLEPVWFESGVEGMFSPVIVPRRGPCEPDCNACGAVCPTGALLRLSPREKLHAKVGTAVVVQHRCLAWSEGKRCMVCQEVCPFGSVRIVHKGGQPVPVPVVDSARCFGCGYCEYHCPTTVPAIRVEPLNALRLEGGRYEDMARFLGYVFEPGPHGSVPEKFFPNGLPGGFKDGPPPGFSP